MMRNKLDNDVTLLPERGRGAGPLASVRGGYCFRLIALALTALTVSIITSPNSNAIYLKRYQTDWALVAMNHLQGDLEQTQCWVELIWRESRFNPLARNGSHYGLAQMRNVKVKDLTPREQVRWHMRYLDHRYDGSPCKALNHLKTKGWH
jgi:hypothetical protein